MTDKKVNEIYDSPEYEQILKQYWNNGTLQIQDPNPIVESIRNPQLASEHTEQQIVSEDI